MKFILTEVMILNNITSFVNISGKLFDIEKQFENHLE